MTDTNTQDYYLQQVVLRGLAAEKDVRFDMASEAVGTTDALFRPLEVGSLSLANRIVMAPMTRSFSPGHVPGPDVADYYRRRAEGGTGLIVTEGTYIGHPAAGFSPSVPQFHGEAALAGWKQVVEAVHGVGGKIMPQLWHVGLMPMPGDERHGVEPTSPSGLFREGDRQGIAAPEAVIEAVVEAFGIAAAQAMALGFDGIQIHGAHGYMIDQFLWDATNRRTDAYGGRALPDRARIAQEIVRACRRNTRPDFPISFRYSQWKQQDFTARLAETPQALEAFLLPLADAGVDIFDCSTRRFWMPEFDGSPLNLAGWTKKITGRICSTVGSVTLGTDVYSSMVGDTPMGDNLGILLAMLDRGDFDLVGVGRALISNPDWASKIRHQGPAALQAYDVAMLGALI